MLAGLGLIAAGFARRMSLTPIVVALVVGMVHAEAFKVIKGHSAGLGLAPNWGGHVCRSGVSPTRPHKDSDADA
nr:hypothetical protein [uncultured Brevundimonas sp.]